jgi:histidyl-tRNA synthetase
MRDFLPERMLLRQQVIGTFRDVFERHGFEPIDTPALEYYETLTGNYGEGDKLIYNFDDHGGRRVGLRYDLTVPLARFVALHQAELTFPFKRYHIAPVWRADRPQRGRFREFWQCDADIVGTKSMVADAEVVSIIVDALSAISMPNFVVHINHRKLLEATARYAGVEDAQAGSVYRAIDKLDKIGPEGVAAELTESGVDPAAADRVVELVQLSGPPDRLLAEARERLEGIQGAADALTDLDQLFDYLAAMGVSTERYAFDLALARGLDYYTGPVFEATVTEPKIGSIAGAGRYDGLVGSFSKRSLPATGISLGLERIIEVVEELGLVEAGSSVSDVLVTIFDQQQVNASLALTSELRSAGLRAEVWLEPGRDLRQQLGFANQRGIPFVVVVGPDELARGVVTVRRLADKTQVELARADVAEWIRRALEER